MSTKSKSKLPTVIQVIAIIVLVLALIFTALTLFIRVGAANAAEGQQVPSIFGSSYLPVQSDKFESLGIQNDSLIILRQPEAEGVMTNDVVIFDTPIDFPDNALYQSYSMGRVLEMSSDGGSVRYTIEGLGGNASTTIDAATVVGIAGWQIAMLGAVVSAMLGSGGVIYFIVIPIFAYIVLQLLVVILRMTMSGEQDDEDEAVPDRYDAIKQTEEPTPFVPTTNHTPQEPLEPISLDFEKKHISAALQDVKSQTFTTIPPDNSSLTPRSQPLQTEVKQTAKPEQLHAIDLSALLASTQDAQKPEENPVFGLLDEQRSPARSDEFKSVLSMVDDLLNDIKAQQSQVATPASTAPVSTKAAASSIPLDEQTTQEFSLHEVRSHMKDGQWMMEDSDSFVQHERSQQLLDNILIELKENALDVQFENIKSDQIDIEKTAAGDGFTIDTPRYKANVNIKMDPK